MKSISIHGSMSCCSRCGGWNRVRLDSHSLNNCIFTEVGETVVVPVAVGVVEVVVVVVEVVVVLLVVEDGTGVETAVVVTFPLLGAGIGPPITPKP